MKIGFTGTQRGMTFEQGQAIRKLYSLRFDLLDVEDDLHHGDCVGADSHMHDIGREFGMFIVTHPPDDDSKRAFCVGDREVEPKPYLTRNKDIVNETEFLIATPRGEHEERRSGTWSTIRYARKLGRPIVIVWPSGAITLEGGD